MKKYQNSKKYNKDHLLFNFSDQRKQLTTEFFKNVSRILTEKYLADFNHCLFANFWFYWSFPSHSNLILFLSTK